MLVERGICVSVRSAEAIALRRLHAIAEATRLRGDGDVMPSLSGESGEISRLALKRAPAKHRPASDRKAPLARLAFSDALR